jgi:hypothetical protein
MRLDEILPQAREDDFIAQELSRLVVDHQNIYLLCRHRSSLLASPHAAATGMATSLDTAGIRILIR